LSFNIIILLTSCYPHWPLQSKKKGRKLQKPGAKAAGQQKARRDQQPVASEKTTKEVPQ